MDGIRRKIMNQKECEVRVQIKQGSAQKPINLHNVAVREISLVVGAKSSQAAPATVERIDIAIAIQLTGGDQVQRDLARGIEVVRTEILLEPQRFLVVQVARVVAGYVVALVASRVDERAIRMRTIIGEERFGMFQRRAVGDKASVRVE